MATLAFDTHKAVKALREAGFDDLQAEAVTDQISAATGENLVTKDDLENAVEKLERSGEQLVRLNGSIDPCTFPALWRTA